MTRRRPLAWGAVALAGLVAASLTVVPTTASWVGTATFAGTVTPATPAEQTACEVWFSATDDFDGRNDIGDVAVVPWQDDSWSVERPIVLRMSSALTVPWGGLTGGTVELVAVPDGAVVERTVMRVDLLDSSDPIDGFRTHAALLRNDDLQLSLPGTDAVEIEFVWTGLAPSNQGWTPAGVCGSVSTELRGTFVFDPGTATVADDPVAPPTEVVEDDLIPERDEPPAADNSTEQADESAMVEPEVEEPPAVEPEPEDPPATELEPEVEEPPATEPEVEEPPATEPEPDEPPAAESEPEDPPATEPDMDGSPADEPDDEPEQDEEEAQDEEPEDGTYVDEHDDAYTKDEEEDA